MSNNPYEPNPSTPQPEENQPVEAPSEAAKSQAPAPDAAPTVPLESNSASQPYGAYGQQNQASAQNNPYASADQQPTNGAYAASGAQLNGAAYGTPQQPNYNAYGASAPQDPQGKKAKNIVGIVALALAILGVILGIIPGIMVLGWLFLFAGFVTGIVGLFQKYKEKITSIIAIVLSVLGGVASGIVMAVVIVNAVNSASADSGFTSTSSPASESSSSSASSNPASGDVSATDGVLKFGETAEYSDGLKFTVSEAKTDYTPSKTAAQGDETLNKYVAFTVTIENGTDQPYEPFGYIEGNSGGKEIDQVFDSEKGMGNISSSKILPGEKVSYDVAFAVADPNNVTLDVTVDFDRDEIIYTNK